MQQDKTPVYWMVEMLWRKPADPAYIKPGRVYHRWLPRYGSCSLKEARKLAQELRACHMPGGRNGYRWSGGCVRLRAYTRGIK